LVLNAVADIVVVRVSEVGERVVGVRIRSALINSDIGMYFNIKALH
jgi:hypothetical protein